MSNLKLARLVETLWEIFKIFSEHWPIGNANGRLNLQMKNHRQRAWLVKKALKNRIGWNGARVSALNVTRVMQHITKLSQRKYLLQSQTQVAYFCYLSKKLVKT